MEDWLLVAYETFVSFCMTVEQWLSDWPVKFSQINISHLPISSTLILVFQEWGSPGNSEQTHVFWQCFKCGFPAVNFYSLAMPLIEITLPVWASGPVCCNMGINISLYGTVVRIMRYLWHAWYIVSAQHVNSFLGKQWSLTHDEREGAESRVMGVKRKARKRDKFMPSGLDLRFEYSTIKIMEKV